MEDYDFSRPQRTQHMEKEYMENVNMLILLYPVDSNFELVIIVVLLQHTIKPFL